jgi:hypothetical protein
VNATATLDFSTIADKLKENSIITIDLVFQHNSFAGPNTPSVQTPQQTISIPFILPQDYANPYELVTSNAFINTIGNSSPRNIKFVYAPTGDTSCDGITGTDDFNCTIPNNLQTSTGSVQKWGSAISGNSLVGTTAYTTNEPLFISMDSSGPLANILYITIPYMRFVDDVAQGNDTTNDVYEFYEITTSNLTYKFSATSGSLHSNRGYEIGMVYMDDYGRSSTALVSNNNSLHVPCSKSIDINKIQVTIPPRQIAPEWATTYKFVIKPDEENYDVIYSNVYYQENVEADVFFLLEGENAKKVEKGDRLIVKTDSSGARGGCVYVTVLEKETFATNGVQTGSVAGTYMKINPNNINIEEDVNAFFPMNEENIRSAAANSCASTLFTLELRDQPFVDVDIPAGSIFRIDEISAERGVNVLIGCPERSVKVQGINIVATRDYKNLEEWLDLVDFNSILQEHKVSGTREIEWNPRGSTPCNEDKAYISWFQGNGTSTASYISVQGFPACYSQFKNRDKESLLNVRMSLTRTDQTVIFETMPQDALPDVWFESADTYSINSLGEHSGSEQDQVFSTNTPAITITDFYNCYSFGNGAESYKIRDSIVGKTFNLGNRVYTTDEKDFKEAHRFADLTYSGVYNEENNINKLNEFNLGLLNFKPLERTFGPIQKLFGRETDILTLQEDKISYVLQGKNLLSDAAAGSALTSVPEVLGTQIARIEEYGISNNPESFVQWGADKYFTDAKRGAVIQLKGSSARDERLTVISEQGMRTWFRDLFIESFDTQKLGGFDPYMDEYVLSSNDILKPVDEECIDCGTVLSGIVIDELNPYSFCVDVGDLVGNLTISYTIRTDLVVDPAPFEISYTYAGVTTVYTSADPPVSDTITLNKNSVADQKVTISITTASGGSDTTPIETFTVGCPVPEQITIIPVSITSDADNDKYIHSEYSWTDGTFVSPLHSRLVPFDNDNASEFVISDYAQITGPQGAGVIPADGATVSLICNKINYDDFVFDKNVNNFRYLRSGTLYANNVADIKTLLSLSTTATPIDDTDEPDRYFATFTMPSPALPFENNLYLIWDYRISTEDDLCFGATIEDACCTC